MGVAITGDTTVDAVAGVLKTTTTTDATASTTGALQAAGGLGVTKQLQIPADLVVGGANLQASQATTSGTTIGSLIQGSLTANGAIYAPGAEGTPASATATCTKGEMKWDVDFIYICISTNVWS